MLINVGSLCASICTVSGLDCLIPFLYKEYQGFKCLLLFFGGQLSLVDWLLAFSIMYLANFVGRSLFAPVSKLLDSFYETVCRNEGVSDFCLVLLNSVLEFCNESN